MTNLNKDCLYVHFNFIRYLNHISLVFETLIETMKSLSISCLMLELILSVSVFSFNLNQDYTDVSTGKNAIEKLYTFAAFEGYTGSSSCKYIHFSNYFGEKIPFVRLCRVYTYFCYFRLFSTLI